MLNHIASDNPVTCAVYAKRNNLLHEPGWKRFKHLAKDQKILSGAINQSKLCQARHSVVYMFGYQVPKDYEEPVQPDKQNGTIKWNATILEMSHVMNYQVHGDKDSAFYGPGKTLGNKSKDYLKLCVRLVNTAKYNAPHKARLAPGGHLTTEKVKSICSGIVSKRLRMVVSLAKLKNSEVRGAHIGNVNHKAISAKIMGFFWWIDAQIYKTDILNQHYDNASVHSIIKGLFDLKGKTNGIMWLTTSSRGVIRFQQSLYLGT